MIVARDVPARSPFDPSPSPNELTDDERRELQRQALVDFAKLVTLGRLSLLDGGNMLQSGKLLHRLGDRPLPLVVYGGRDYECVTAFGGLRYQGASVIVVAEEAVQDLDAFFVEVARQAPDTRQLGGHQTFVFPASNDEMEPVYQLQPWQGTYLTRFGPTIFICATSDVYLEEMLARLPNAPRDRALPLQLPEWTYVDTTASTWGLRRVPERSSQQLRGYAWAFQPEKRPVLEVVYLPAPKGSVRPDSISRLWFSEMQDGKLQIQPASREHVQTLADGAVKVTAALEGAGPDVVISPFTIYGLQGYSGALKQSDD